MNIAITSDNYIRLSNIRRHDTDAVPSSFSSVTAKIIDSAGSDVSGSSISLSAVSGKTDAYEGTFPDTITLTEGAEYEVQVTLDADSLKRTFRQTVTASYE